VGDKNGGSDPAGKLLSVPFFDAAYSMDLKRSHMMNGSMAKERIQKILAAAGYGSRRACEELVEDGNVEIDGRIVSELPILVDPAKSKITVNGKPVRPEKFVYFLLNKPKGFYCTNADPEGRRRAVDLMVGVRERVFPVGRLDADSMGLLIMRRTTIYVPNSSRGPNASRSKN